jgi:hypothetical protein
MTGRDTDSPRRAAAALRAIGGKVKRRRPCGELVPVRAVVIRLLRRIRAGKEPPQ